MRKIDMSKYKIIFPLLISAVMITAAYCQEKPQSNQQTITVSGTVTQTDFAGSTITILTADGQQMVFSVGDNAIITRGTNDIGLMEVKPGHSVTIKYEVLSPGKDVVVSIVDNKPVAHE